jgi:ribA/ribD-fused uncharacterized protein
MYPASNQQLNYESDDEVCFFSSAFDPLNNWSAHAVKIWNKTFPTLEHAYHYRKYAETYPSVAAKIIAAPSPWAAMQIDRAYRDKRRSDWHAVKVGIMTELLRAKVAQNDDVRACLLATGTKQIVENSPWDTFWGIGADRMGKNTLGGLWMLIRSEITSSS